VHDLEKHGDPAAHEERGELLKTVLGRMKRGDAAVDVVDWSGAPRTLALDPALDPAANLARAFAKAKKAREAVARTAPRLEEAKATLAVVEAVATPIAGGAPSPESLERARAFLTAPQTGGSARRRAAKAGKRQPWRSFQCSGGVVVRVGRGAKDNDALVKSARGNDLWLHARNQAGAHVIVPSTGADVDGELALDAAHLAAHFSAARGEARVDVQTARVKNLKKPGAGAPAGFFHVAHESVVHVRVDADRVARLLAAEVPA
jgi:predicted ribosome quality control (RQC) complex YloA/Tae2 family protein